jgi:hypothetical protein
LFDFEKMLKNPQKKTADWKGITTESKNPSNTGNCNGNMVTGSHSKDSYNEWDQP